MAKWNIEGANRETGEDVMLTLEAESEPEALKLATGRGILVSKIRRASSTKPAPPSPTVAPPVAAMPLKVTSASSPLEYATPPTLARHDVPEYSEIIQGNKLIRICASILSGFGWLGVIAAIIGVAIIVATRSGADLLPEGVATILAGLLYAIPCFIGAIMLRMYAALAVAVRDMARNSFK